MNANGMHELVLLDKAKQALSEAQSFDEIKDIRDKAEAVRKYAQSASLGLDIQNRAAEVKLRAERLAGTLLSQLTLRGGDRRSKTRHERVKLDDLGISRNQSTRWQIQARVPENVFIDYVKQTCDSGKELTSAKLMRIAKQMGEQASPIKHANGTNGHARNGDNGSHLNGHRHVNGHGNRNGHVNRIHLNGEHSLAVNLAEIVGDLKNHHQVLVGILRPIFESENDEVSLKPAERRMLRYLLGEARQLFDQLDKIQHNASDCMCRDHTRRF